MLWKAISIFVLELLSVATGLKLPSQCCFEDRCYIRPDPGSIDTWTQAQERCTDFNSTLPIVDSAAHNRSFVAALDFFQLSGDAVWIGARAFDVSPNNWTWLDGNKYFGADVEPREPYNKSYAYLSKRQNEVIASPSSPITIYSYICQYQIPSDGCKNGTGGTVFYKEGRCFVKYDEPLPWFNARNFCLSRNGDLASFSNIALLDDVIDANPYWVGLRHSQWKWINAANNLSDVKFTLWSTGQPNDMTPTCISTSTDVNFPAWRDFSCAQLLSFICQVESSLMPTPAPIYTAPPTTSTTTTFSLSPTNRSPSESLSSSTTKHNKNNDTTHSISPKAENQKNDTGSVNIALAVGLGVGIGVPVIILIVVVIIVIIVRRNRQSGKTEEQNRRDQSVSLPQDSPTPPTYMQLNMADRLEKNVYAKIGSSPDYLQTEESTHDSKYINISELSPYAPRTEMSDS